jgi:hypothetical protein
MIADGIAEVAVEWSKITGQSSSALEEILSHAKKINEVMATFSQGSSTSLGVAQAQTKTSLESLRSAASFAVIQGKKIEDVTDAMRNKSGEIGKTNDLLDACFTRIDTVLADLENMKLGLELDHPLVRQEYDGKEFEQLYSASYTTETEREILRSAIYGTELSLEKPCLAGNSVELF